MFTITEKSALLPEKVKFFTSHNPSRHQRLLLFFCKQIMLDITQKAVFIVFLLKRYISLDIGKVEKNDVWLLHAYIYLGVMPSCNRGF